MLSNVSIEVGGGSVCGLLGHNGAGKSSLLKVITGLVRPSSGRVVVLGETVPPGRMPHSVGALIEEPGFYPWMSARENLMVAAAGRRAWESRIDEVLAEAGLDERAGDKVGSYSQGMRQRLGIARSLLGAPKVWILDEPTNGLDPAGFRWVREAVVRQCEQGVAVLVSSHVLSEVELLCDQVVILADGHVALTGATQAIIEGCRSLEELFFRLTEETIP